MVHPPFSCWRKHGERETVDLKGEACIYANEGSLVSLPEEIDVVHFEETAAEASPSLFVKRRGFLASCSTRVSGLTGRSYTRPWASSLGVWREICRPASCTVSIRTRMRMDSSELKRWACREPIAVQPCTVPWHASPARRVAPALLPPGRSARVDACESSSVPTSSSHSSSTSALCSATSSLSSRSSLSCITCFPSLAFHQSALSFHAFFLVGASALDGIYVPSASGGVLRVHVHGTPALPHSMLARLQDCRQSNVP